MSNNEIPSKSQQGFNSLGLSPVILEAIKQVGYETPSQIQAEAIPYLVEGRDLLGVAQTGTGKTAAFALPLLTRLDTQDKAVQLLCLAPTRELAIQVEEAFKTYAKGIKGFKSVAICGGQSYPVQLRALKQSPQVVVGTPGRVMDHMRKGSLKLDNLKALILDEADEMLRMGFIEDVEWVLEHTPDTRQMALFSATMPGAIKRIAQQHLQDPAEISIKVKTTTAENIVQRYWQLHNKDKPQVLGCVLESENFDAAIIFVRTKTATLEVAEQLQQLGHKAEALNGDMAQPAREKVIDQLKKNRIDIVIATDVAARGLDVERITHVINYDVPYDTESYVHRIGRTGRAGRSGDAILFITNREQRLLQQIQQATKQKIGKYRFPSPEELTEQKKQRFFEEIEKGFLSTSAEYQDLIQELIQQGADPADLAAVLASMLHEHKPFAVKPLPDFTKEKKSKKKDGERGKGRERDSLRERGSRDRDGDRPKKQRNRDIDINNIKFVNCQIDVGLEHGATKGQIVGAIANECDIDSAYIGKIKLFEGQSQVEMPDDIPKPMLQKLQKIRVCGRPLKLEVLGKSKKSPAPKKQIRKRKIKKS